MMVIDEWGVDLVHGHCSPNRVAIAFHRARAILYGCGDFVKEYERLGEDSYGSDFALVNLADSDETAPLERRPFHIGRSRPEPGDAEKTGWLPRKMGRKLPRVGVGMPVADLRSGLVLTQSPDDRQPAGPKADRL
ncbi:MAG TPA: hypothetical protein VFO69_09475 [Allosphingosinicella sp.]|nr:hypothetical protein [Allosphingosinicella sp.]